MGFTTQIVGLSSHLQEMNQISRRYMIAQMMSCTWEDHRQEREDL